MAPLAARWAASRPDATARVDGVARVAALGLALILAAPAAAAPEAAAPADAALVQPRLEGRWFGAAGQDAPAALWWAGPQQRDALGPATVADALTLFGVPGLVAGPAPGNGTTALIVRHGRNQPLSVAGAALPGMPPLLPGMIDADLLLAEPLGGVAAGGISLLPRRPGKALAGLGEFAAGGFGSRKALGRIDLPMGSGVRLGLAGTLQHDLGWLIDPASGQRGNRGQRGGLSGLVDIDLAPGLTLSASSLYARSQAGNRPASLCNPVAPGQCGGRYGDAAPAQRSDLTVQDLRLAHDGGALRLALAGQAVRQSGRIDVTAGGYRLDAQTADSRDAIALTGEADLDALSLRAGAGYSAGENRRDQRDTAAGALLADRLITQSDSRRHVFGQARYAVADGLSLTAGLRAERRELRLAVVDRRAGCSPCLGTGAALAQAQTLVTPEAALSWRASPQIMLFARSAREARLPGWNLLARSPAELVPQVAETGWHHEAGIKADLAGGRVRIDASGFAARTRGLVSPLFGIDPLAVAAASTGRADMTNHGIDIVANARPLPPLELAASFGWQQARWSGAVPAGLPARPLYAPDTTASLWAAWHQPLAGTGSVLVPRLAARWRSAMAVGPAAGLTGGMAPGGWQVAAALQLEIPDGGWLVSLECDNCLDAARVEGAFLGQPTLAAPRWWQLRFTRRF
ncbi:MAG: TonB-dependent receptor [Sphingomonadales bacterium]